MTKPIPHHDYHAKSDAALLYIIKDAGEAARCMRNLFEFSAECKYLDQINDASTVLRYRRTLRAHNASVLASIHINPRGNS